MLNVGPTAEGEIPKESIERLEAVGRWIDVNGEAIYGTEASPFHRLPWGRCTRKTGAKGTTLYFHVFDWPTDGKLFIPGLKNKVESATLLAGGVPVRSTSDTDGVALQLPGSAPDADVSVIRVETAGALDVDPIALRQQPDGSIHLHLEYTEMNNPGYGTHARLERENGSTTLESWTDARAWMQWTFRVSKPGTFAVMAEVAAEGDAALTLSIGKSDQATKIPASGKEKEFARVSLGTIEIAEAGIHELRLRPTNKQWKPVRLRGLTLEPKGK